MKIEFGEQETNQAGTANRFTVEIDDTIIGVVMRHRYGENDRGDWRFGSNIKYRLVERDIDVEGCEAMLRDCEDYEEATSMVRYLLSMYWDPDK